MLFKRISLLWRTIILLTVFVLISQLAVYFWIQRSVNEHFREMDAEILTHAAHSLRKEIRATGDNDIERTNSMATANRPLSHELTIQAYNLSGQALNHPLNSLENHESSDTNQLNDIENSSHSASVDNRSSNNQFDILSLRQRYADQQFDLQVSSPITNEDYIDASNIDYSNETQNIRYYRAIIIQEAQMLFLIRLPTDVHHVYLNQFQFQLKLILFLITVLLLTIASLSVYWGFSPLATFVKKMQSINSQRLEEHIHVEDMPLELRPLAESYNVMMDTLERNFESLSRFSNNIAHELRTPIATLGTQTQVMLSQPRSTAEYVEQLHHQHDTLEQLSELVNNMLLLAKTQRGIGNEQLQRVQIDVLIDQLIDYYEFLAEERGLVLIKTGEYAQVNGDKALLKRLFANLISNAVYYAKSNSKIRITGQVIDKHDRLQPNAAKLKPSDYDNAKDADEDIKEERLLKQYKQIICIENELAQLTTQDQVNQFFERFYRHRNSSAEDNNEFEHMGTGLGLSIVTSIVKAHNGEVSADVKGNVLQIRVELPVQH